MTLRVFKDRQIFWTTALFTLVATVADVVSAAFAVRLAALDLLWIFLTSAAWAAVVSFAATAGLILIGWLFSLSARDPKWRRRQAVSGAAIPIILALVWGGSELLSGPGVAGKSWVELARVAWFLAVAVGLTAFSYVALWILWTAQPNKPFWPRRVLAALLVLVIPVALCLDHRVYPRLYPVAHVLLWLVIFVAILLFAVLPARAKRFSTRTLGGVVGLMLGWSAIVLLFVDPLAHAPVARAAAYRETLFLKRALTHLRPAPRPQSLDADPEVIAALRAARRLDGALLDRTFPNRLRMNVVVISMDALRPDRLSRNGYRRPLTPNLDALLASGTVFTNAWTSYPFTLMAFGSAFRGVYASATDGWRYREAGHKRLPWAPQPTVASLLGERGRRTEAVVGFPRFVREVLSREEGFAHFNAHADPRARDRSLLAEEVTTLAIDALDRDPEVPFFLWVHYFDPHAPYEPPPPHPFGEAPADLYDTEILYADRELGRFLDALRARSLLANTAIVFFSDHGEDLVEFDHGTALTQINVHVPLGLVLPGVPPREVALAVDLTDVAPTILDLVGVEKPAHLHGQSLLPCALLDANRQSDGSFPPDLAFCEMGGAGLPQARQFSARAGSMKIIYHADSQTYALFDLAADPGELRDVARDAPDTLARMRRVLDAFQAVVAETPQGAESAPASRNSPK